MLPLKPTTENDFVLTVFWADNFDMNVKAQCGGGAINITHLITYQEVTDRTEYISNKVSVIKSKRSVIAEEILDKHSIVNFATNNKEYIALSGQFGKTYFM